jgi:hypothetical protein
VSGRLAATVCRIVVGFCIGWWASVEVVHQPAGLVPVDPGGGDHLQVGESVEWAVAVHPIMSVGAWMGFVAVTWSGRPRQP